jgi:hypothetical protein
MHHTYNIYSLGLTMLLSLATISRSLAEELPLCIERSQSSSIEAQISVHSIPQVELLSRLVYAESQSTGFPDDPLVYQGIAWGVMNRVRVGEKFPSKARIYGVGIAGVIFKKGQFNPAISLKSPYSKEFLCPRHGARWQWALDASQAAQQSDQNPFLQTSWEQQHGVSLVVNFYYPASIQARAPEAPWERDKSLLFVGDVSIKNTVLSASKIRFYRLAYPPK